MYTDNGIQTTKPPDLLPSRANAAKQLAESLFASGPFHRVLSTLVDTGKAEFVQAPGSLPAFVAASLVVQTKRPVLYAAADIRSAERVRDDLRSLLGFERVVLLPPRVAIPYDPLHQNHRFDERAAVFEKLISGDVDVLIAPPSALVERHVDLTLQKKRMIRLAVGDEIDSETLSLVLSEAGMSRESRAEEPGHFSIRGSVIDLFPPAAEDPVRLELWGDEITDMRRYDAQTQRSGDKITEVLFYAGEAGEKGTRGIWELLPKNTIHFIDDRDALHSELSRHREEIEYQFERMRDLEKDLYTPRPDELYHRSEAVLKALDESPVVIHRGPASSAAGAVVFGGQSHEAFLGDLKRVVNTLVSLKGKHFETFLLVDQESQADRMEDLLVEHDGESALPRLVVLPLHAGFTLQNDKLAVFTDHEIFGRHKRTGSFRRKARRVDPRLLDELKKGDFVVHTEFGIGRYLGLKRIRVGGVERDNLQIEFRDGVKVYVRLDQFSKLQKYQGTEAGVPKLSKIGGADWDRARRKTQSAVEEIAQDILKIYAKRQVEGGYTFSPDTPWQREMEAAFDFIDTPDQEAALVEIKKDMENPMAMDRLLLGDVGFGKTEVAIRGAFKAIQDGKQVAVLVPTTILAQQHFATFSERLRRYPVHVEALSRFRSRKEQKEIVAGITSGKVDIVIGTHRLLSKDIQFKNLGLLVIDEEHRFGVKHKEAIRKLRATVDVLTLSATPIPRTLHMALSGARDMSMISTPPMDRLPIETEIVPFDTHIIRESILREIARGGQVYFVHNRVQTIQATKRMLERLLPNATFAIAHGQMKEHELETVMDDFLHEKHQVLVSTMIIESGLDIPNVNTLVVNRADRFGLAQLYQLRGRIGRSHRQAYAYLLTPPRMLLQPDARRRLETIAEHTRLGSGFQIAMRDLEIRGAGNLLGPQQSGFINAVGFELYTQMLQEAVARISEQGEVSLPELKSQRRDARDVRVDAPVDAVLPPDYIHEPAERVDLYRRLSRAQESSDVLALREELRDRFGPLPDVAENLIALVMAQALAAHAGVMKIDLHPEVAFLNFANDWGGDDFDTRIAELTAAAYSFDYELRGTGPLGLRLALDPTSDWQTRWSVLHRLLEALPEDLPVITSGDEP
ncbi:MAG: transcription-repair coupling factor [bacterium]